MSHVSGHQQSSLRINNRRLVLNILRNSQDITVNRLAERIRLSKTTLSKIMDHFVQAKLALRVGKDNSSEEHRRRPELFRFNESYGYVITITVYGFAVLLALSNVRANIFYKEVVFIDDNESLESIVGLLTNFIARWQKPDAPNIPNGARLIGIVVASSGVVDSERGTSLTASRFHSWPTDAPLVDLIHERLEIKAPLYIDNYNRYFAFAEKTLGCAKDNRNIVDIVVGWDGMGAGIIADDRILRGPRFLAGEIGHMLLDPSDTETCHCGGTGCFERLVSVERLLRNAAKRSQAHESSEIHAGEGSQPSLQAIFDSANDGNVWAQELMDVVIRWFAIGIHNINLVFNAEVIIVSGVYRTAGRYFLERLSEEIGKTSLPRMKKNLDIRYSSFDEEGPLRGGASYVIQDYFGTRHEY